MDRIITERLELEPVNKSHINSIYKIYSSSEVCNFFDIEPFTSITQASTHVQRWIDFCEKGTQIRYAILKENNVIGTCGLYLINNRHQRACLGYDLLPDFWGFGYAQEAVDAMLYTTQEYFSLHRIQAEVLQENASSINLLERLGFQFEGLFKQYEKWGNKGFVDLMIFSKIYPFVEG